MFLDKICKEDLFNEVKQLGSITKKDIKESYISHLLEILDTEALENSKIVWDGSNGAALFMLESLVNKLKGKHFFNL